METISLQQTKQTPGIHLDDDSGEFNIWGKSVMQDTRDFYRPIISWLKLYTLKPNCSLVFRFAFDSIDEASYPQLLSMLKILKKLDEDYPVTIKWIYPEEQNGVMDTGIRLAEEAGMCFEFICQGVEL